MSRSGRAGVCGRRWPRDPRSDSRPDFDPGVSAGEPRGEGRAARSAGAPGDRAGSPAPRLVTAETAAGQLGAPRAGSWELGFSPGKEVAVFFAQTQGIPRLARRAWAPRPLRGPASPCDFLAASAAPRTVGAARGPHRDRHGSALCGRLSRLESRAHREPLARAAAAGRTKSAPGSPRVTTMAK